MTSGISISTGEIPARKNQSVFLRVKWTSVFKGFYIPIAYERVFIHERFQPWLSDWENFAVFDRWSLMGSI